MKGHVEVTAEWGVVGRTAATCRRLAVEGQDGGNWCFLFEHGAQGLEPFDVEAYPADAQWERHHAAVARAALARADVTV
jgi:hypothetical protein